jgi:choline-sulfatase
MSKPNIVWIYCDELRTDALNCYGNPYAEMQTPNIDGIAQRGIRFTNSFCNSPVCVPSRCATLTGLYCEDTGVYHNEANWQHYVFDQPVTTFPEVFKNHGYQTVTFGKTHLPNGMKSWQIEERSDGGMKAFYKDVDPDELAGIKPPGIPLHIGGRYPADRPYPPEGLTTRALEFIKTAADPYLLRLSFVQPHTPVFPRAPYDTLYQNAPFPDSITMEGSPSDFERRFAENVGAAAMSARDIRLAQAHYYGLVAWIDEQVGKILEALKEAGKTERTILVFGADHGTSLGENGMYQKQVFAPQVHRVPMLITWPGKIEAGQERTDINEGLDLPRTLFNLAEIEPPEQFKGRDIINDTPPEAIYSTIGYGFDFSRQFPNLAVGRFTDNHGWPRRACIRTQRYRLDKTVRMDGKPVPPEQEDIFLADVQEDPREVKNIAGLPENAPIVERLSAMLDHHLADRVEPPPGNIHNKGRRTSDGF